MERIPIESVEGLQEKLGITHSYNDIPALLANQVEQSLNDLCFVADASADPRVDSGWAIYKFNGVITGVLADDYTLIASQQGLGSGQVTMAEFFVDGDNGSDANNGTRSAPWQTIAYAVAQASSSSGYANIYIAGGTYAESFTVNKWVRLIGLHAWNSEDYGVYISGTITHEGNGSPSFENLAIGTIVQGVTTRYFKLIDCVIDTAMSVDRVQARGCRFWDDVTLGGGSDSWLKECEVWGNLTNNTATATVYNTEVFGDLIANSRVDLNNSHILGDANIAAGKTVYANNSELSGAVLGTGTWYSSTKDSLILFTGSGFNATNIRDAIEEAKNNTDGMGTSANGSAVDIGGGNEVAGIRSVTVAKGASANKLFLRTDQLEAISKTIQLQQDIASFFGRDDTDTNNTIFGGMGMDSQGGNYPAGLHAGFFVKNNDTGIGSGMIATPDGEVVVWKGQNGTSDMKAFRYGADYAGIDWATDLAGDQLYIPHQKRVLELIGEVGGGVQVGRIYVNKAGDDTTGNGSAGAPYLTIAKAVAEAVDGDVIMIGAGTYTESPTISKHLTLQGTTLGDNSLLGGIAGVTIVGTITSDVSVATVDLVLRRVQLNGSIAKSGAAGISIVKLELSWWSNGTVTCDIFKSYSSLSGGTITCIGAALISSRHIGNIEGATSAVELYNSIVEGDVTTTSTLAQNNSVITGTATAGGGHTIKNQASPKEVWQELVVTDANYTAGLVLNAEANRIKIVLDAALTNDWSPATITGWVEGRDYQWHIIKQSDNGVDMSTARAVPNVGYDDDIDPFYNLVDIDTTQKRAMISAVGFKSTFGQFGRMIITDTVYVEP